jgi:uncharacterized protein
MYSTISNGIKDAMRNKDRERLSALRDIKSKLMLEATKTGTDGDDIPDAIVMAILTKLFKQRTETADLYAQQARPDLETEERAQAAVIAEFLPQPLTEEEIIQEVNAIIQETNASSMADMGKVMGIASSRMAGKADGKLISGIVRSALQN